MSDVVVTELQARLGEDGLVLVDVRSAAEYSGDVGAPCDQRRGHIPGARNVDLTELLACWPDLDAVRDRIGADAEAEVIAYCHTGQRSGYAVEILRAAGYRARNYPGSWHEWSADPSLPVET